jgi:hypothetical protein
MEDIMDEKRFLTEEENTTDAKTYTKPVLSKIRLVAGEAVLSTCKYGTGGLSGQGTCRNAGDLTCVASPRS